MRPPDTLLRRDPRQFFYVGHGRVASGQSHGYTLGNHVSCLGQGTATAPKEADLFPPIRIDIEQALVRNADCIIAECPQDHFDLVRLYNADERNISVVPCGFDAREFAPMDKNRARRKLGWAGDTFYILQLGRIVPRKGIDNVIHALARLRTEHGVDAHLCVVGSNCPEVNQRDDRELNRLMQIAADTGVHDYVYFAGLRERHELALFYGAADVFVTTPWYEPFGITPVEAMACARPVIGANVGGIRYTVADDETGYLVAPRDPIALSFKLAHLARNPETAWRMGNAGLRRARRMFTWERVAAELDDVYSRTLNRFHHNHVQHISRNDAPAIAAAAGGQEIV